MKKLSVLPLLVTLAFPAIASTTKATTTQSYGESIPLMKDSEMIRAEEESFDNGSLGLESLDQERMEDQDHWEEQEMMEDRSQIEAEEAIDYDDRTRTDRARKALDTSSDASDDN